MLNQSISRTPKWIPPANGRIHEFMRDELAGVTPMAVGKRLRLTREAMGLAQNEFGRLAGISPSAINNIEKGKNFPSLPNAVALRNAHKLTLDWICAGDLRDLRHELAVAIEALRNARQPADNGCAAPRKGRGRSVSRAA